ncbi:MAG TPA: M64 family metallopeptidase [Acidobacteriota bacterium]|nr:M64 family metallopeptidase [Acidobacteriota bacterium]
MRKRLCRYVGALGIVAAVSLGGPVPAGAEGVLYQLLDNGPRDKRVNIVMFAEGYTANLDWYFVGDAQARLQYFLSTPPFDAYPNYFNAFAIFVPSNQTGSDHPFSDSYRDTYFNSSFDNYDMERLLMIAPHEWDGDWDHGEGKVYALLAEHVPEYDIIIVLVNDLTYGGSGGDLAVASRAGSAPELVMHEMGHSYAGLGDEYEAAIPGFPADEEPNTTQETVRELIKWNVWIEPTTPIPTPETSTYADVVGLFEGAHYAWLGWYRPRLNCKMRTLTLPYCEVCSETLVKSDYSLVSPIETFTPDAIPFDLDRTMAETLSVVPMQPAWHALVIDWSLDDVPVAANPATTLILDGGALGLGGHTVKAVVSDTTHLVRNDSAGVLHDSVLWAFTVCEDCYCSCDCHADPECDGVTNVLDVVTVVNVAFRGAASISDPACPFDRTDVDCSGFTNVLDVVRIVNVAFRSGDPELEFCGPCSQPDYSRQ